MDGPRGVRNPDLPSLRALTDLVMREGLVDQYIQLFNEENYENLRICADAGKVVCHVGMIERDAILFGCTIRAGCIGGVCTHPEYRMRGLASACFDDTLRKARADGVDIMIVSGDRNLYRMRGCVHVGRDEEFTFSKDALPAAPLKAPAAVTVEVMQSGELGLVEQCYAAEPVRFVRPTQDYKFALQSGWVMNWPSDFLVIREKGEFRGYLIAPRTSGQGTARITEFAGDRHAILAALPHVVTRYGLTAISLHVARHDTLMRTLCHGAGLHGSPRTTAGTVTLVNFPQLMRRIRPLFAQILGEAPASQFHFSEDGDSLTFAYGPDRFATGRAEAARLLFGTLEEPPPLANEIPGPLRQALETILPLPTLWYGINYV